MLRIIEEGILDRSAERGAFMPWITPLHDGSFIASQHVGTSLGANDCRIEILRSSDGRAWHNEGPIHATDPNFSYRAPQINALPDGRLLMTATRFECSTAPLFDPDSEALQRPEMLLYWSSDLGLTWSEPQVVPVDLPAHKYTANGAGRLLQLTPTRWMYPLETWKPAHYQGPPDQKAAALFSADQGRTWGEWTLVADDLSGRLCYWDQMCTQLDAERIYTLLWTHSYGTSSDQNNHYVLSEDQGRTWSTPQPTNLRGQVCTPIALRDGRVAAIYNDRRDPQGVRIALSEDLKNYSGTTTVFDAGAEAALGTPESDNFLAEHLLIAFGKPGGIQLSDGDLLVWYWCTSQRITHTRWARLRLDY
jgi:hypothetical protein